MVDTDSSTQMRTDIVNASACWDSYETLSHPCYLSRQRRAIHGYIRARRIQAAETRQRASSAICAWPIDVPSFPLSGELLLGCYYHYCTPIHPVRPSTPCYPHHVVVCIARCELPRCSPFLRTPLSSLPRLLARPTRTFAPVKEKTGAAQEE